MLIELLANQDIIFAGIARHHLSFLKAKEQMRTIGICLATLGRIGHTNTEQGADDDG
jgi:predicted alpha/beta hydrolase family esterase